MTSSGSASFYLWHHYVSICVNKLLQDKYTFFVIHSFLFAFNVEKERIDYFFFLFLEDKK